MTDAERIAALESRLSTLTQERDAAEENFTNAAALCAGMHAAAVGEVRGPDLGVIDDVKAIRSRMLAAEARLSTERERAAELRRIASDFLTLTWWANEPGVTITFRNDQRSGTEVRELINLRDDTARALASTPPPDTATTHSKEPHHG